MATRPPSQHPPNMMHYRQWSAVFASYFTILGLWTAFGPGSLMATDPRAAPMALACITLAYFVATPLVRLLWNALGFSRALVLVGAGVGLALGTAALVPQWLAWCVPLAFFFGTASYTLCETRLLEDLALAGRAHHFGRSRKWGSFGFLAAAALGGAVFSLGSVDARFSQALGLCALVYLACCLVLARALEGPPPAQASDHPGMAANALPTTAGGQDDVVAQQSPAQRRTGTLAICGMRLAEALSTTWFGAYWLATGHGPLQTGLLCALPVAAEFLAMWRGGDLLARHGNQAMLLLCCALSALRWLATPLCSALWCAVPLQALHAFTFGFFYPASLVWLKHSYPQHFFQARYFSESLTRALLAVANFAAAGWVIAWGGHGTVFAASSLLAALGALWWLRMLRRQPVRSRVQA